MYSYALSKTTAFLIEGELDLALRRRRMLKRIDKLDGHYIVCGIGRIGTNVAHELAATGRAFVVIDTSDAHMDPSASTTPRCPGCTATRPRTSCCSPPASRTPRASSPWSATTARTW